MAKIQLLAACMAVSAPALALPATPFGITSGQDVGTLDVHQTKNGMALLKKPPKPNPMFDTYAVRAYATTGVCEIRAHTPVVRDEFGASTRGKIRQIIEALTSLYGPPSRSVDDCAGATCKPEYWAMHVDRGARRYAHLWRRENLLSTNLNSIVVIAEAASGMDLRATLIYEFIDNKDACAKAATSLASDNL